MRRLGLLGAALSLVPLLSPRRRSAALVEEVAVEDLVIQTADEVIAEEIVVRSRVVADKPPRKFPPRLDGIGVHDARLDRELRRGL